MKNKFRSLFLVLSVSALLVDLMVSQACAAGLKISEPGNKHNLSNTITNSTVTYKASGDASTNPRGTQICIFCHTPHSANVVGQAPLWNRYFSSDTFQRYSSSTLQIRKISNAQYGGNVVPSGSTKLCLSCHDGVSKLGAVYNGPEIAMVGGSITNPGVIDIDSRASFNSSKNKLKSGHHPVSFVYTQAIADTINSTKPGVAALTYKMPVEPNVKLDKQGRMQCTTCHDAHQNQSSFDNQCYPSGGACTTPNTIKIAPFWVYGGAGDAATDQQTVCTTCHPMNAGYTNYDATKPWQTPP
jgi:cytochrome c553